MPEVISDTSPIQYLHQLGLLDLLPSLYQRVTLPPSVVEELETGRSLGVALPDVQAFPWIEVRGVKNRRLLRFSPDLGSGETEALALAMETPDSLLLLDDGLARRQADLLDQRYTGTIGVLLKAQQLGKLASIGPVLDRLTGIGFFLHPKTREAVLRLVGELR